MNEYISSEELKNLNTLIKEFMLDRSGYEKTFSELLKIFNESKDQIKDDNSDDLRILNFYNDMKNKKWTGDMLIQVDENKKVLDGIHRGVAYLKCIEEGVSEKDLPKILHGKGKNR